MIRDATATDLEPIVAIYNAAIPGRLATADTEPVSAESRRSWLCDRDFAHYPLWVIEHDGRVAGWLSFSRFYGRPAYAATAEVSVYVHPASHRSGLATRLMEHAFERGDALGLQTFLGFVFAHNERSLSLCEKFGFQRWGHLPRIAVLDGQERDLVVMGMRLEGALPNRAVGQT
jgi:phosphinothricin acetyltransferase